MGKLLKMVVLSAVLLPIAGFSAMEATELQSLRLYFEYPVETNLLLENGLWLTSFGAVALWAWLMARIFTPSRMVVATIDDDEKRLSE